MPFPVIYDACVLYPAPLRDLLVQVAALGCVQGRWTARIHEEWIRSVLAKRSDLTAEQFDRTRALMDKAVEDCLVTGYEALEGGLDLPDKDDRHVLAAAILARASVIVTFNLKDFPAAKLKPYAVEAQHPDDFLRDLFDLHPGKVCAAVKLCRERLRNPPKTVQDMLEIYQRQGLTRTIAAIEQAGMAGLL